MTTITSGLSAYRANSVAPTSSSVATGVSPTTTTAKASPIISLSNSTNVTISKVAALAVVPTTFNVSDAVKAYKAAIGAVPPITPTQVTIKDAATSHLNLKFSA